ncbi:uncharacterized protein VTP21DRAFT_3894 [Calcarisporiella thermophila]|uniref:uncharacterized protein n=1 Tax=Calcarisporiella thermophila TaxID=911321 RepID=UPI003742B677
MFGRMFYRNPYLHVRRITVVNGNGMRTLGERIPARLLQTSCTAFKPNTNKELGVEDKRKQESMGKQAHKVINLFAEVPRPAMLFGFAGTAPYLATSAASIFYANRPDVMAALDPVHIGYGACIISFLGAVHWGLEIAQYNGTTGYRRYSLGILPPLFAWQTLLLPTTPAMLAQFLGFTGLLFVDMKATDRGWAPRWYIWLRYWLTGITGGAIITTLVAKEWRKSGMRGTEMRMEHAFKMKEAIPPETVVNRGEKNEKQAIEGGQSNESQKMEGDGKEGARSSESQKGDDSSVRKKEPENVEVPKSKKIQEDDSKREKRDSPGGL